MRYVTQQALKILVPGNKFVQTVLVSLYTRWQQPIDPVTCKV